MAGGWTTPLSTWSREGRRLWRLAAARLTLDQLEPRLSAQRVRVYLRQDADRGVPTQQATRRRTARDREPLCRLRIGVTVGRLLRQ